MKYAASSTSAIDNIPHLPLVYHRKIESAFVFGIGMTVLHSQLFLQIPKLTLFQFFRNIGIDIHGKTKSACSRVRGKRYKGVAYLM